MARVVVVRWTPCDTRAERDWRERWERVATEQAWVKFIDLRGVFAHYALEPGDRNPIVFARGRGAIFGPLFESRSPGAAAVVEFEESKIAALVEGGGADLLQSYWGAYGACLHDTGYDKLHVLREPSGAHPMFYAEREGAWMLFTHAADFVRLVDEVEPDLEFLSAFIANSRLVSARTGLCGVRELLAGERLTLPRDLGAVERMTMWRPSAGKPLARPSEFASASRRLRQVVLDCAASWSASYPAIAHRLSGGLDSSIVLAALSCAGAVTNGRLLAINEFAPDVPESDERVYAREVAAYYATPLDEVEVRAGDVDYRRMQVAAFTAKPSDALISFATPGIADLVAAFDPGALVTSGQGGDQLFHRSHASSIAGDAWRDRLPLSDAVRITLDTARLGRRPVWSVLRDVVVQGLLCRPERAAPVAAVEVLDGGVGARTSAALIKLHPWADVAQRAPPARAVRISHMSDIQYYRQRDVLGARFQLAPLLTSQPVIEFCLTVPPYVMTAGGVDRALARAAFADLLPENVGLRTAKGSTTRFHTEVLERNIGFMREMLMGGELERAGIIRSEKLGEALQHGVFPDPLVVVALSTALVAELWLRKLKSLRLGGKA